MLKMIVLFIVNIHITLFSQALYMANSDLGREYQRDIYFRSPEKIHQENLNHLNEFLSTNLDTYKDNAKGKKKIATNNDTLLSLRAVSVNPVVSMYKSYKYDPKNLGIGFCFGRAMFVNIDLRYRGIDQDSIKKVFVVGPMQTPDGSSWGWHVATIVKTWQVGRYSKWVVIDPILDSVVSVKEWYEEMRNNFSTDKKLKLYITESGKFGPGPGSYSEEIKEVELYNNYFNDMMEWFQRNTHLYSSNLN